MLLGKYEWKGDAVWRLTAPRENADAVLQEHIARILLEKKKPTTVLADG